MMGMLKKYNRRLNTKVFMSKVTAILAGLITGKASISRERPASEVSPGN